MLLFKYNIKAKDREGQGDTWIIKDLDTGIDTFTNHIEIKVPIETEERALGHGFGMTCHADIEWREHPKIGKFVVLVPVK